MKNLLVLGSKGMLGYAVTNYFMCKDYNVTSLSRLEFDIAKDPVRKLESHFENVEAVINCAGVIKPMIEQTPVEDVIKVNSIFPRNLAKLCNSKNIQCYHITTDCVYSGEKGKYDENDLFDADDIYGMTKNAGENNDCMVLRTSIIGEEDNQRRSLLEWVKSQAGKEINGFTNHLWNGVTTVYLAKIIEKIMVEHFYEKGIFHIHSPNSITKCELVKVINEVYGLQIRINPVEAEISVDRTLSSLFNLTKICASKSIEKQICEMKMFFEKQYVS